MYMYVYIQSGTYTDTPPLYNSTLEESRSLTLLAASSSCSWGCWLVQASHTL